MRLSLSFAAATLLAAPAWAAGKDGMRPVSDAVLSASAHSCLGLTNDLAADRKMLEERGWKRGSLTSGGKPVADEKARKLEFYGYDGALLLFYADENPGCMIMTKSRSPTDRIQTLVNEALGRPPVSAGAQGMIYILDRNQDVLLKTAADGDERLVQIVFTPIGQKN